MSGGMSGGTSGGTSGGGGITTAGIFPTADDTGRSAHGAPTPQAGSAGTAACLSARHLPASLRPLCPLLNAPLAPRLAQYYSTAVPAFKVHVQHLHPFGNSFEDTPCFTQFVRLCRDKLSKEDPSLVCPNETTKVARGGRHRVRSFDSVYTSKFMAETLIPMTLELSPQHTADPADADVVLVASCTVAYGREGSLADRIVGHILESPTARRWKKAPADFVRLFLRRTSDYFWSIPHVLVSPPPPRSRHGACGLHGVHVPPPDADCCLRSNVVPNSGLKVVIGTNDHGFCANYKERLERIKGGTGLKAPQTFPGWHDEKLKTATALLNEGSTQHRCFRPGIDVTVPTSTVVGDEPACPAAKNKTKTRSRLAFLAGKASSRLRWHLAQKFKDDPDFVVVDDAHRMDHAEYLCAMADSVFCLAPRGQAAWSPRLDEAIHAGCIPVIIANHYEPPLAKVLNYSTFSVRYNEMALARGQGLLKLKETLLAIPEARRREMLANVQAVQVAFRYTIPIAPYASSSMAELLMFQLWSKKHNHDFNPEYEAWETSLLINPAG